MANEIQKLDAYHSLKPDVDTYGPVDDPIWPSGAGTPPTDSEINAEVTRLQAAYDAKKYQRDRAVAYPDIADQLDMQYWDKKNGTTTWVDAVAKVKSDNPKP